MSIRTTHPSSSLNTGSQVLIMGCALPFPFSLSGVIHTYAIIKDEHMRRVEKWYEQEVSRNSLGYLHYDLFSTECGLPDNLLFPSGSTSPEVIGSLEGECAKRVKGVLDKSFEEYPFIYTYFPLPFPGPNSNTYIQWILDTAECGLELPDMAYGRDYARQLQFIK